MRVTGKNNKKAKWTVMAYMAGDNNLDRAALGDIAEMARVGSSDKLNILVQLDRADDLLTRRFFITKGGGYGKNCIKTFEETNTGNPRVLEDFMLWAMEKYPANRYFLILWNHGGGWWEDPRRSIAYDDSSDGDALDNQELKGVLSRVAEKTGEPLDILGMDACLMNMVEVAYQLKDCVQVMVGSEEEEPFDGWPYNRILQVIKNRPGSWPTTIGKKIVREYIKSYRGKGENVTQSALNVARLDDVVEKLDSLSLELISSLEDDDVFRAIISSRHNAPRFFYDNYIDLYRFTQLLKASCSQVEIAGKAGELLQALRPGRNKLILYQRHSGKRMRHTHGISIYFPSSAINPKYRELDFCKDCRWGEFLEKRSRIKGLGDPHTWPRRNTGDNR